MALDPPNPGTMTPGNWSYNFSGFSPTLAYQSLLSQLQPLFGIAVQRQQQQLQQAPVAFEEWRKGKEQQRQLAEVEANLRAREAGAAMDTRARAEKAATDEAMKEEADRQAFINARNMQAEEFGTLPGITLGPTASGTAAVEALREWNKAMQGRGAGQIYGSHEGGGEGYGAPREDPFEAKLRWDRLYAPAYGPVGG